MKNLRGQSLPPITSHSLVFSPPFCGRPDARTDRQTPFHSQAPSCAMCLQVGRVDYDNLLLATFGSDPLHHPGEDADIAGRFHLFLSALGKTYSRGASGHRKSLRLMRIMQLRAPRSSTRGLPWPLGKNGFNAASSRSMGFDPNTVPAPISRRCSLVAARFASRASPGSVQSEHLARRLLHTVGAHRRWIRTPQLSGMVFRLALRGHARPSAMRFSSFSMSKGGFLSRAVFPIHVQQFLQHRPLTRGIHVG
jgi:hypothetical protein